MSAKQRMEKYLDINLPEEILLFRVSMVLSLLGCSFIMLLTLLLRMSGYVTGILFAGALLAATAIYAERVTARIYLISGAYLFVMFFILLPLMSIYVPYAIYDFPVYFLTGIVHIAFLFKKKWAIIFVMANSVIDLLCIYNMLENDSITAASQTVSTQYYIILFCRIIMALFIMGTVCGVLTSYRSRVLRREIKKSIDMEKQAEQLSYAKNMFLVNVSHEIRTPLNAILGVTELLLDQDVDDRIKDSAFHISNSSKALLSITNELMDFSRLDDIDPVITNKPYYIGDICNELINVISVRFADNKTELFTDIAPDIPEQLIGDALMIRQIMLSIMVGVVKSLQSGKVCLFMRKEDSDEDQIRLFVEVLAEGTFRYSYQKALYQEDDMDDIGEEPVLPLPCRLVQLMDSEIHMEEESHQRRYFFDVLQGYLPGKTMGEKPEAENIRILFYENTLLQGTMFAKTLRDMDIEFCQAFSDEMFLEACVDPGYTHIMVASEQYIGLKEQLETLLKPQSIILIGSDAMISDEALVRTTFARPVNCLNLDALLNGRQNGMIRQIRYKGEFICPDAHVMVVDDNIINLEVATSFLRRYQAQVSVAESGKVCLKMLQKEPVDLILLDYMMPEMDGIDTLKHIRALGDPKLESVPIVALTANAVSGAREMFLEAGFTEYLSKPIEKDRFEKVLRSCLSKDKIIYTTDNANGEKDGQTA